MVLGVDSPRVTPELLRFLMATAAGTAALAVVPRVEGRLHTVCAVYKKSFAQAVERELLADRKRLPSTEDAFNLGRCGGKAASAPGPDGTRASSVCWPECPVASWKRTSSVMPASARSYLPT